MASEISVAAARRYLLGQISDEGRADIERESCTDERYSDVIATVEQGLIEDYLTGGLSPEERRCFDEHYLAAPQQRRRVAIVRGLMELARRRQTGGDTL